ncbi:UNVERIFIED_CONTAM: hypothetical protein RMT77_006557 [Armadillidium vulgare]
MYTDGRKGIDEGNDVYEIIEDIKREEISDDFKSIKMLNQLLKNIIDYSPNEPESSKLNSNFDSKSKNRNITSISLMENNDNDFDFEIITEESLMLCSVFP